VKKSSLSSRPFLDMKEDDRVEYRRRFEEWCLVQEHVGSQEKQQDLEKRYLEELSIQEAHFQEDI